MRRREEDASGSPSHHRHPHRCHVTAFSPCTSPLQFSPFESIPDVIVWRGVFVARSDPRIHSSTHYRSNNRRRNREAARRRGGDDEDGEATLSSARSLPLAGKRWIDVVVDDDRCHPCGRDVEARCRIDRCGERVGAARRRVVICWLTSLTSSMTDLSSAKALKSMGFPPKISIFSLRFKFIRCNSLLHASINSCFSETLL